MSRLILVRHGQTHGFPAGDYRDLTERGVAQARALGHWLSQTGLEADHAVVGPRERQVQTWAHLREAAGWRVEAMADPELDEVPGQEVFLHAMAVAESGDAEARSWFEGLDLSPGPALRAFRRVILAWAAGRLVVPDVPTWADFRATVGGALARAAQAEGTTVMVSSAGWIGAAVAGAAKVTDPVAAMELTLGVYNTSLSELAVHRRGLRLVQFNAMPHLGPGEAPTPI